MHTNDAIAITQGRRWSAVWMLFLVFSGAYHWIAELAPLVHWRVDWSALQLLIVALLWALLMRWFFAAQARRIAARAELESLESAHVHGEG